MSFERPTLTELIERIEQDFVSRLELSGAVLRRAVVRVFARVIAGASHLLHGHLDYLGRQIFPDQSDEEFLERQGSLFGVDRTAPTFASGYIIITGTGGTVIPVGTVYVRSDGVTYESTLGGTLNTFNAWQAATGYTVGEIVKNGGNLYECIEEGTSAGSGGPTTTDDDITDNTAHWRYVGAGIYGLRDAVACTEVGEDGNCDGGTVLTFESPVAGANADTTSAHGEWAIVGGADEEDLEDYRERVIERMRNPPHGGAESDYILWAKEVAGVTRAWVYPLELGAGTVVVRFMRDDDSGSGIPSGGEVSEVQSYIDERRPVTADVTVEAPTGVELDLEFSDISPDTAEVRAAVEAEVADLILREGEPGGTIELSKIRTAIGTAAGVEDYTLVSPAADVTHSTGEIAIMGTVTWP